MQRCQQNQQHCSRPWRGRAAAHGAKDPVRGGLGALQEREGAECPSPVLSLLVMLQLARQQQMLAAIPSGHPQPAASPDVQNLCKKFFCCCCFFFKKNSVKPAEVTSTWPAPAVSGMLLRENSCFRAVLPPSQCKEPSQGGCRLHTLHEQCWRCAQRCRQPAIIHEAKEELLPSGKRLKMGING